MEIFNNFTLNQVLLYSSALLASLVGILTLYNAARLKTGILAVSTYAFGAGIFCVAGSLLLEILVNIGYASNIDLISRILILVGFALLGYGSYRIYQMSRI